MLPALLLQLSGGSEGGASLSASRLTRCFLLLLLLLDSRGPLVNRRGNAMVAEMILLLAPGLLKLVVTPSCVESLFVEN